MFAVRRHFGVIGVSALIAALSLSPVVSVRAAESSDVENSSTEMVIAEDKSYGDDVANGQGVDGEVSVIDDGADAANRPQTSDNAGDGAETDASAAQNSSTASDDAVSDQEDCVKLSVEAHVQNLGWQEVVGSGDVAGTVGRNLNLEGLRVTLEGVSAGSGLIVQTHVTNIGWMDAVAPGDVAGTVGRNLPIEALRITLTEDLMSQYDVWYRVHSADFGWNGWAKNGESAGSQGYAKAAQAVQIELLPKGSAAPGSTESPFRSYLLRYQTHVQDIGWQEFAVDGQTAGTTGRNLGLESVTASLGGLSPDGDVELRAHVRDIGWQGWTRGNAGTTGRNLPIEAIQMRLTGEVSEIYSVWYRVHVTDFGWLGWVSDGEPAGTTGKALNVQAVEIVLIEKGGVAPGDTSDGYVGGYEVVSADGIYLDGTSARPAKSATITIGNSEGGDTLRSFAAIIDNQISEGSLIYRSRLAYSDWTQEWVSDGQQVNPNNDGLAITAIEMKLAGPLSEKYDVWYRLYSPTVGWLGWACNGAPAGIDGGSVGITALQISLLEKGTEPPGSMEGALVAPEASAGPHVSYQAHVSELGWQASVADGADAGTSGRGLALEGLRVALEGVDQDSSVEVSAHVTDIGWQDFAAAPGYAGTTGQNRAIQAIKIQLTGGIASSYDVYYRVHCATYGWLGWAKNGEAAGTTGLNLQAEAVEVNLVTKGGEAPSSTAPALIELPTLSLETHVQDLGWMVAVGNGAVSGTTGQGLKVEGIKLSVESPVSGHIAYRAHVQDIGWQDQVVNGALAGTTGQNKRVEAVQIQLTGNLATYFDVWYRVHVEEYGWLGWTKNGAAAGTSKIGYRIEAVQVKLVAKNAPAPGSTYRPYTEEPIVPPDQAAMTSRIMNVGSATNYLIAVDTITCRTGIYTGSSGHWTLQYYWLCGPGKPTTPTVKGQYAVQAKGYVFGHGYSCYYYTQFYGDYLFHSIKYDQGTFNVQDGRLGMGVSEGCVRLAIENAKWIYDNIPRGTKVVIW